MHPTKPVGPILSDQRVFDNDWDIAETINGPRRVVASPKPINVLDLDVIGSLVKLGAVVICGGGGGIPVIRKDEHWLGVPAVIDKDHLSGMLATELDANALIISTGVDAVRLNFGGDDEEIIRKMELEDAEKHLQNGEFPVGSMGPKVAALVDAVRTKTKSSGHHLSTRRCAHSIRGSSGTTVFNERAIRGSNRDLRIKSPSLYLTKLMAHWLRGTPLFTLAAKTYSSILREPLSRSLLQVQCHHTC